MRLRSNSAVVNVHINLSLSEWWCIISALEINIWLIHDCPSTKYWNRCSVEFRFVVSYLRLCFTPLFVFAHHFHSFTPFHHRIENPNRSQITHHFVLFVSCMIDRWFNFSPSFHHSFGSWWWETSDDHTMMWWSRSIRIGIGCTRVDLCCIVWYMHSYRRERQLFLILSRVLSEFAVLLAFIHLGCTSSCSSSLWIASMSAQCGCLHSTLSLSLSPLSSAFIPSHYRSFSQVRWMDW